MTSLMREVVHKGVVPAAALLAALVCALVSPVHAIGAANQDAVPAPQLRAAAWYLVGEDGEVLAERNADMPRAVASITKLMTAIVTLEHAQLSEVVTVSPRTTSIGESTANLRAGEQLPVSVLLRAMLIASANDAAEALAVHVGGSSERFVDLMNAKAEALGLEQTSFVNPHGLDAPGHVSSAEDATVLVRYALGIPFVKDALDRESVELPSGREFETTDDLLTSWAPLVGGKTGHTGDAGWSEAAAARARGVTVYGTVLGSPTRSERNEALETLLRYGLERYHPVVVVDASRVYAEAETGYDRSAVALVARRTILHTIRKGEPLVERVVAPGDVELPVRRGQRLGRVEIYEGSKLVASSELVAAEAVSEPGWLGKASWYAKRTAANLWGLVT